MDEQADMSDLIAPSGAPRRGDRRIQRTRAALRDAFDRLVLTRGYEALTAADIAEQADVGRSTFYEHFQSKEDILAQSLSAVLTPIAESCFGLAPRARLVAAMEHVWENRKLARALLSGRERGVTVRQLARLIEQGLAAKLLNEGPGRPALPGALVATYLANGQLALIDGWLSGRYGSSAADIAAALQAASEAVSQALAG